MIIDLSEVEHDPFANEHFDVCIIGGGVVGISVALNLSRTKRVLLLEAGGYNNSVESMAVYEGENVGQEYFDLRASRLRYFGGSSNHWGGDCHPLDAHDFARKSYLSHSGWPIRKSDLDPYLERAESILDLNNEPWDPPGGVFADAINRSEYVRSILYKYSPPTRFGDKYGDEIESRQNITCALNANVVALNLADAHDRLSDVTISDYDGNRYTARANRFVLATGGIENARLLLNSNHQAPHGLGNDHGLVGRFFTDHMYTKVADIVLEDHVKQYVEAYPFGDSFRGRLKDTICSWNWLHGAVESARGKDMDCLSETRETRHFFAPTLKLLKSERILNWSLRMRVRTPGHSEPTDGKLFIGSEQSLNPSSTVSLSDEKDRFGLRRTRLNWQLCDVDLRTLQIATIRFGEAMAEQSIGRVRIVDWLHDKVPDYVGTGGHHHMCTTRMAVSPDKGVVDRNMKVFGLQNLFVAGSSSFGTGGHANPTLTIVQMSLRLADHLSHH